MSEKEWERFFELVTKITNLSMPVQEKKQLVLEKAKDNDDGSFEEFCAWGFYEE